MKMDTRGHANENILLGFMTSFALAALPTTHHFLSPDGYVNRIK